MASVSRNRSSNRVLAIFPGALGDLVCFGPALRELSRRGREMAPETTIELMARPELARFAVGRMGVAHAHSIDRREMAALFAAGGEITGTADFFRAFGRIYSFFAAEDSRFRDNLVSAAAPATVSFHRFRPAGDGHITRNYLAEIGAGGAPLESRIDLLAEDIEAARGALARLGLDGSRIVLVFPGSGSTHKNWPAENFVALTAMLAPHLRPLVVFGPAEHAMEALIAPQLVSRGVAWLSTPPLGTLAGLARFAAAFVGNDSGMSHLAAAVGAPGVVLFGPTDPDRWRPLGEIRIIRASSLASLSPSEIVPAVIGQSKRPAA
ncbi:MAG TPA: glycosyltransferase family 9 protein [Candidatus Binataceae bacterium]|nr:glycosyltransferase family 9 protein [Candidatus Binataceae bacterium]